MPVAARILERTSHPGIIPGPGVTSVLIAGLPAAVVDDVHICQKRHPHAPNIISGGSSSVLIGGKPAARLGDQCACGAIIVSGASSVIIGG